MLMLPWDFLHEIVGLGLPLAAQSMTAMSLWTTVTSLGSNSQRGGTEMEWHCLELNILPQVSPLTMSWAVKCYKLSFCIRSKQSYIKMLVSTASLICARNLCLGNVRLLCTSSIPPIPRGMLNLKQVTYILNISTTNSYKVLIQSMHQN